MLLEKDAHDAAEINHIGFDVGCYAPRLSYLHFPSSPVPRMPPLLRHVYAGDAREPDVIDDRMLVPFEVLERHGRGYFLQVEGQCMSRVYPEGCYILIDPDRRPTNGSVAVVSIDGADYMMRRLHNTGQISFPRRCKTRDVRPWT